VGFAKTRAAVVVQQIPQLQGYVGVMGSPLLGIGHLTYSLSGIYMEMLQD
jgi:hypothetical protein